jgi:hypothetical protein
MAILSSSANFQINNKLALPCNLFYITVGILARGKEKDEYKK